MTKLDRIKYRVRARAGMDAGAGALAGAERLLAEGAGGNDRKRRDDTRCDDEGFFDKLFSDDELGGPGDPSGSGKGGGPSRASAIYFLVGAALIIYVIFTMFNQGGGQAASTEIATSELVAAIKDDRVHELTYTVVAGEVEGTYWTDEKDVGDEEKLERFTSHYVGTDSLDELMARHPEVTYHIDTSDPNMWSNILVQVVPTILLVVIMFYFMRQMLGANGRAMQFGKTDAKTNEATRP